MKRALGHIALVLLAVLSLTGCHRKGRIIPAKTLEKMYVDMFLADQWLRSHDEARKMADTTLFYEPIFRRYGYSSKDYDATISHYIDRPDKYVKILRRSGKELNLKYLEYTRIAEHVQKIGAQDRAGYGYVSSDFHDADSILLGTAVPDTILIIEKPDVERRNRVRPDKKQAPGILLGDQLASDPGENM